ncbi:MAG TPA: hypothetical protein VLA66_12300, partial [Thermoanaerobaculia bacterium]|nr:hypothetical protein [Thermoanaerobaculia bacterium]
MIALAGLSWWALGEAGREPLAVGIPTAGPPGPLPVLPDLRTLTRVEWSALPGWPAEDPGPALAAFRASCANGFARAGASDLAAALAAAGSELDRRCGGA